VCVGRTWHLIDDMEKLRRHLQIERWQVFGGSWGSTLVCWTFCLHQRASDLLFLFQGIAYAEMHPTRVTELIVRGIFLLRECEVDFLYKVRCFGPVR